MHFFASLIMAATLALLHLHIRADGIDLRTGEKAAIVGAVYLHAVVLLSAFARKTRNHPAMVMFDTTVGAAMTILIYAILYQIIGIEEPVADDGFSVLGAIYFSIVTFTTLGYGDLKPLPPAQLVAASEAILGYVYLGAIVALITRLGATRD